MSLETGVRKELAKLEAFREHSAALRRHMDNTSIYLRKEVKGVEGKINEAKEIMFSSLGIRLDSNLDATLD